MPIKRIPIYILYICIRKAHSLSTPKLIRNIHTIHTHTYIDQIETIKLRIISAKNDNLIVNNTRT